MTTTIKNGENILEIKDNQVHYYRQFERDGETVTRTHYMGGWWGLFMEPLSLRPEDTHWLFWSKSRLFFEISPDGLIDENGKTLTFSAWVEQAVEIAKDPNKGNPLNYIHELKPVWFNAAFKGRSIVKGSKRITLGRTDKHNPKGTVLGQLPGSKGSIKLNILSV